MFNLSQKQNQHSFLDNYKVENDFFLFKFFPSTHAKQKRKSEKGFLFLTSKIYYAIFFEKKIMIPQTL